MKTTNALAVSMRKLLANLHPPSPPTARESQQLLDVIQKSFKNRLDEQHPPPSQRDLWPNAHERHDIPIDRESASSHATNTHLSSILANPVLRSLDGLHTRQDVISRFDKLVAEPGIDVSRLIGLTRHYSREILRGKESKHTEGLSDRLNGWLHTTDRLVRQEFLLNEAARAAAIDLAINEHNEAILWTWLRLVYERRLIQAEVTNIEWLDVEDHLVSGLMRISVQKKKNADAAQQFLEACRYRLDSGRGVPSTLDEKAEPKASYKPLIRSGKRLASAIIYHRHRHAIDSVLFNKIFQYLPRWTANPVLNSAFCAIYNPAEPTANHLHMNLRDEVGKRQLLNELLNDLAKRSHSRKISMIALLDASKLALEQGKKSQASFLIDFVSENYPESSPARKKEQLGFEIERNFHFVAG